MDRIDLLAELARQSAALAARQIRLLAELAEPGGTPDEWASLEVAAVLKIAPATAAGRVHLASVLVRQLPATLTALSRGEISERNALQLASAVAALPDAALRAVEHRVLARAAEQTPGRFAATLRRAVLALDASTAEERHRTALADRRVIIRADDDGMAQLWALLPADGAATLRAAIDAVAAETRHGHRDDRTADQLRADALVAMGGAILSDPALRKQHGSAPAVQLTVSASTLLGRDDPAELSGYGPISARQARRIVGEAKSDWRIVLVGDDGRLLARAKRTYRPPAELLQLVMARDRCCTFPGCPRPAASCDIDHLQPFSAGGQSTAANLHPLCRRHHRAKHQGGWRPARTDTGSTEWLSPAGHRYRSTPEPLPVPAAPPF